MRLKAKGKVRALPVVGDLMPYFCGVGRRIYYICQPWRACVCMLCVYVCVHVSEQCRGCRMGGLVVLKWCVDWSYGTEADTHTEGGGLRADCFDAGGSLFFNRSAQY